MKTRPSSCFVPSQKQGGICGPWIPDDGKIVTHTVSKAGKMTQKYWTSKVSNQNSSKGCINIFHKVPHHGNTCIFIYNGIHRIQQLFWGHRLSNGRCLNLTLLS